MAGASWPSLRSNAFGNMFRRIMGIMLLVIQSDAVRLTTFQAKLVVLNAPRNGTQLVGSTSYHVRTIYNSADWILYSLVFGPSATKPGAELKTGDIVQLNVDVDQSGFLPGITANPPPAFTGSPGTLYVHTWTGVPYTGSVDPLIPVSSVYYTGYTALRLSTAVWVITDVCDMPVDGGLKAQDVSQVLFGPSPGAALRTPGPPDQHFPSVSLNRLMYECSYGGIVIKRSSTLVLNLSLPCSAVRPNGAVWNATPGSVGITGSCGNNELWGWMEYAVARTRQVLGIDLSPFRRRVLVLPPVNGTKAALCPSWQQRGTYGCDEVLGCDMWVRADRARLPQLLSTQLGSSLLLQPAASSSNPNSSNPLAVASSGQPTDSTCLMGSSQEEGTYQCFNGPNAYKLLMAKPLVQFDASSYFYVGDTRVIELPAAGLTAANLLLVIPNWKPAPSAAPRPLYGQYRAPVGGDAGLARTSAAGRLALHSVNSMSPPIWTEAAPASVLLAALSPGESYRFEPAKVMVRFKSWTPPVAEDMGGVTGGLATVEVCRYLAVLETGGSCYDGIDNDCDGLVDFEDPDCLSAVQLSSI